MSNLRSLACATAMDATDYDVRTSEEVWGCDVDMETGIAYTYVLYVLDDFIGKRWNLLTEAEVPE